MATLTVQAIVQSSGDDPAHLSFNSGRLQIEQGVSGAGKAVYEIGTSEENIALPGDPFTAPEYVVIVNLDDTNFVRVGMSDGGVLKSTMKIKPGRFALIPIDPAITLRGIADTAAVRIAVFAWEGD